MDYCCSEGNLEDKIICDLDKTPDLSQQSPQNYPKCGHPVDGHYCQGCALLRKKFKDDIFTSGIENRILQDSSEPSNDNTNVANALREPFVVNQDPGKNSSQSPPQINHHCCYGCGDPLEVPIILNPEPFNNQTIKELPPTVQSFDPKYALVYDSPNVFNLPPQLSFISCEFYGNDARYGHYCTPQVLFVYPEPCYNQDFDFPKKKSKLKKSKRLMPDIGRFPVATHLDTIPITESDEFIKSSVENLVPNPSESEGDYECDVPVCDDFTTFSNILFYSDYDSYSSDDQLFSDEDFPKEIYSNPLFDEEINSMKIDPHHFNAESDLIESLLNHDFSIISSLKIDSLSDEFTGELTLLKSISLEIDETDCEETYFIKRLLYDNSSPRPPEEFVFENSNVAIESFPLSPIPVEDSDSLMEETDLSFTQDYLMPPGIKEDNYDSERDIHILDESLSNDSLSLPENESFHFDIPSFSRPPSKPLDEHSYLGCSTFLFLSPLINSSKGELGQAHRPKTSASWEAPHAYLIPGNVKTHAKGFCTPVFISSASFRNHRLLYDNSSPRPPKEFVSENSYAEIESLSPSHIPVKDNDSLMEEIDLSFTPDYPIPPGIEDDDYDSERDILILDELVINDSLSRPKKESFHFDIPLFSRPLAKPPDGNT
nr:hypothetical protein [Tanacetum cinerariifolium]